MKFVIILFLLFTSTIYSQNISNCIDLEGMGSTGNFYLTQDINCTGRNFSSINSFSGVLEGNGLTIMNITILNGTGCGFINNLYGTVRNIVFMDFRIELNPSTSGRIGLVFGTANGATVQNVSLTSSSPQMENIISGGGKSIEYLVFKLFLEPVNSDRVHCSDRGLRSELYDSRMHRSKHVRQWKFLLWRFDC